MSYLIDTHSHIYYDKYKNNLDEIIDRAKKNGVEKIICVGTDLKSSQESLDIANKYKNIFCTVGIHPHETKNVQKNYIYELESMSRESKVIAIGESGLDYYYNYSNPDIQKKCFIEQIQLSKNMQLPIVIHNRNSDDDLIKILERYKPTGVIHCFSGDIDLANKILSLGLVLSFTGIITFKNSTLTPIIKNIDISKFMIETDSPYLAPEPFRGKINEPGYVKIIAEKIAKIKNIPLEDVINHTTKNAFKLFPKLK